MYGVVEFTCLVGREDPCDHVHVATDRQRIIVPDEEAVVTGKLPPAAGFRARDLVGSEVVRLCEGEHVSEDHELPEHRGG